MQSIISCGRLLSRAFANGIYNVSNTNSQSSGNLHSASTLSNGSSQSQSHKTNINVSLECSQKFKFVTAISGFGKSEFLPRNGSIPPPKKLSSPIPGRFGDDSYFVSKHNKGDVLGVADGVGGWREWGIDPGEFSQSLIHECERLVARGSFCPSKPQEIISKAYCELFEHKKPVAGSSTACVVSLCSSIGVLSSANIGDSGFIIVRGGQVVHRSMEQTHYFNTPYQLSLPPPGASQHVLSDRPESASTQSFDVLQGDLLLLATDGVFDNLPDSHLLSHIEGYEGADAARLQVAADNIVRSAIDKALDQNYMSPFAKSARRNGINTIGGKPDDITVILATVMGFHNDNDIT